MVLTPEFVIRQDPNYLHFQIICNNIRAEEMELIVDGKDFHFNADPYMLILHFQHNLVDSEDTVARYDIETGIFSVSLKKAIPGEDFPEILLYTTLKPQVSQNPMIQVVNTDKQFEYTDAEIDIFKYGFNFWASGFFRDIEEKLVFIADIQDPDSTPLPSRRKMRIASENEDFEFDRIIRDFLVPYEPAEKDASIFLGDLTQLEQEKLLKTPRLDFIMSKEMGEIAFRCIADVVYATVYDVMLIGTEINSESHWNCSKLSATLSWFDGFVSEKDLLLSTVRRSLVYPISRNWVTIKNVWNETLKLFKSGRPAVLKALLHTVSAFEKSDHKWRLNRLYINPMISWIQEIQIEEYIRLVSLLDTAVSEYVTKEEVNPEWCIELLEKYADQKKDEILEEEECNDVDIMDTNEEDLDELPEVSIPQEATQEYEQPPQ